MVDTDGRAIKLQAHSASIQDRNGAGPVLRASQASWPFVALGYADGGDGGPRVWALLDKGTGQVASAKRAKLWRGLSSCTARTEGSGAVEIHLHDGTTRPAGDPALDGMLSSLTGRPVSLTQTPPPDAEIVRSHPEAQITEGLDVDVAYDILKLGGAVPAVTFLDYAPLHLITTATLDGLADDQPSGTANRARYRPNVVIRSPDGTAWFPENAWLGGTVRIGDAADRSANTALRHSITRARRPAIATPGPTRCSRAQPVRRAGLRLPALRGDVCRGDHPRCYPGRDPGDIRPGLSQRRLPQHLRGRIFDRLQVGQCANK